MSEIINENTASMTVNKENTGEEYAEIIGVTFKNAGKIYYFDAAGVTANLRNHVIVDTARGHEYGTVALANRMVPVSELVLPLRRVLRVADRSDDERYSFNCEKEKEAFSICVRKIMEHGLSMKLIDVEYTFDNSKLLFYFTSEERVDFRELVKDLASVFKTRIELRQIGLRDEAKIMGGFGICGREFCCHSFLGDFVQVSIKMAKEQNLSLNAAKISGACGRLMCCLRYEHDTYQQELKKLPKPDSKVLTPDGPGVVTEVQPLTGLVKVKLEGDPNASPAVYDKYVISTPDGKPIVPEEERKKQEKSDKIDKNDKNDKKEENRDSASASARNEQIRNALMQVENARREKRREQKEIQKGQKTAEETPAPASGEARDSKVKEKKIQAPANTPEKEEEPRKNKKKRDFRNRQQKKGRPDQKDQPKEDKQKEQKPESPDKNAVKPANSQQEKKESGSKKPGRYNHYFGKHNRNKNNAKKEGVKGAEGNTNGSSGENGGGKPKD